MLNRNYPRVPRSSESYARSVLLQEPFRALLNTTIFFPSSEFHQALHLKGRGGHGPAPRSVALLCLRNSGQQLALSPCITRPRFLNDVSPSEQAILAIVHPKPAKWVMPEYLGIWFLKKAGMLERP